MNMEWVGLSALFGLIVGFWNHIREWLTRLRSYVIVTVVLDGELARAVSLYCWTKLRRSPFGDRRYAGIVCYVRPVKKYLAVAFEQIGGDRLVFWKGWKPLLYGGGSHPIPQGQGSFNSTEHFFYRLSFLRGTWNTDKLLLEAVDLYNARRTNSGTLDTPRFYVNRLFGKRPAMADDQNRMNRGSLEPSSNPPDLSLGDRRVLGWTTADIGPELYQGKPWHVLAYPANIMDHVEEARRWLSSRDWYQSRGIPWRLGWLLHSGPGTGKSSLVRAMAQELDLPIHVYDLTDMNNHQLSDYWRSSLNVAPLIVLLEDFDAIFKGRENRLGAQGGGLTYDCLLNVISGVESADGLFLIITTNNINDIDPAMGTHIDSHSTSSRPGRIDRVIQLPEHLSQEARYKVAYRILGECSVETLDAIVERGQNKTGAQFQDMCTRQALKTYWAKKTIGSN
jgi:hypothetical protein